jgi:hypothetical protein
MVREGTFPYGTTGVSQSSDAAKIFQTYLAGADREYIVLLLLDGKHRVKQMRQADAMRFGHQSEEMAVAVKAPGAALLDHVKARFVVAIQ